MAQASLSTTETALENQQLGGLQIRVAALCTLIQMCDGYDLSSVAWAVPSLILPGICRRRRSRGRSCGRASASWSAPCRPARSATVSAAAAVARPA